MPSIKTRVDDATHLRKDCLTVTPPTPKSVKIEISGFCDFSCHFCVVSSKKRKKGHIKEGLYYKILDEIRAAGVQEVGLFWMGESFINKNLPKYIKYAKDIGIPFVFLTTNGRLATPDKLKEVFESGLDSLKFSMNASNEKMFHRITTVDAFDKVVQNIQRAKKIRGDNKKPFISASTAFDPERPEDFQSISKSIEPYVDEHYKIRLYESIALSTSGEGAEDEVVPHEHNRELSDMLPCWSAFKFASY